MNILVLNSGSSSLKFRLITVIESEAGSKTDHRVQLNGTVTGIGKNAEMNISASQRSSTHSPNGHIGNHGLAVKWIWEILQKEIDRNHTGSTTDALAIDAVGVRVVHGGHRFTRPVVIDPDALEHIEALSPLAPLHNPPCLDGLYAIRKILGPRVPIVAVFDTSWYRTLPDYARTYAIPAEWRAQHGIERFGFHGIAHASLVHHYARYSGRSLEGTRLITFQLGQGCSATATKDGVAVDTSMGFTPLEGLVMGTRAGDLDPAVIEYLTEHAGLSVEEITRQLNTRSGLLGLTGGTADMRQLLHDAHTGHDPRARLALEVFCYRARKYLGAYLAALGGAEAVIFGGGIGERAPAIRAKICQNMAWCGLSLDESRNLAITDPPTGAVIPFHSTCSDMEALVSGTDEEEWIARETRQCLNSSR